MAWRTIVGIGSVLLLVALIWSVLDGVIYLHGNTVSRFDQPVAFWLMVGFGVLAALSGLYWAVWEARGVDSDTSAEPAGESAQEPPSRWLALPVVGGGVAVGVIVAPYSSEAFAEAVGGSVVTGLFLLFWFRDLWPQRWFWLFFAAVAAAHAALLAVIPWPEHHEWTRGDTLFWLIDVMIVVGLLDIVDRIRRRRRRRTNS